MATVPFGPLDASGAGSAPALIVDKPTSPMIDDSGIDNAVQFAWRVAAGTFSNGPAGRVRYFDSTMGFGLNINNAYQNDNLDMAAVGITFENLFANPGNVFATETHLRVCPKDTRNDIRWLSNYGPELESDWAEFSDISYRASLHSFKTGAGIELVNLNSRGGSRFMDLLGGSASGFQIRFNANNTPTFQQLNAAGNAFLNLPFIDTRNRLSQGLAETINTSVSLGIGGRNAREMFISGQVSGDVQESIDGNNPVTGTLIAQRHRGDATGLYCSELRNTRAGGNCGHVVQVNAGAGFFAIENGSASVMQLRYDPAASRSHFDDGVRGGAGAKIGWSVDRVTGLFETPNGSKLATGSVAALPAPNAALTGVQRFATNARLPGQGAGAGTGSMVVCNGTVWEVPGVAGAVQA